MNTRLVYLMGPSGAGKDSVLAWARERLDPGLPVHWARRTITRHPQAGGEAHEAVDEEHFHQLRERGALAMHWRANGLAYGLRHEELAPLAAGGWVLVNGSREHFAQAARDYPGLRGVHITARPEVLRQRLLARGRENAEAVAARLARATAFQPAEGVFQLFNDGELAQAGQALLDHLRGLPGWPRPSA
jgi:ribose 1,5-bisphosphokinase